MERDCHARLGQAGAFGHLDSVRRQLGVVLLDAAFAPLASGLLSAVEQQSCRQMCFVERKEGHPFTQGASYVSLLPCQAADSTDKAGAGGGGGGAAGGRRRRADDGRIGRDRHRRSSTNAAAGGRSADAAHEVAGASSPRRRIRSTLARLATLYRAGQQLGCTPDFDHCCPAGRRWRIVAPSREAQPAPPAAGTEQLRQRLSRGCRLCSLLRSLATRAGACIHRQRGQQPRPRPRPSPGCRAPLAAAGGPRIAWMSWVC